MVSEEAVPSTSLCPMNYRSAMLALVLAAPADAMDLQLATPGQVQVKATPTKPGGAAGGA